LNFSKIYENAPVARVAHARLLLEAVKFFDKISGQQMVDSGRSEGEDSDDDGFMVSTSIDGWWGRIVGLKLRVADENGGSEASHGQKWEIGWERETPRFCYGVNASMVHRCSWRFWTVGSRITWSSGCYWLDLQVDRMVRMGWVLIWYGAVYRELGTPSDVAQQDRRAECFKGWDGFEF